MIKNAIRLLAINLLKLLTILAPALGTGLILWALVTSPGLLFEGLGFCLLCIVFAGLVNLGVELEREVFKR